MHKLVIVPVNTKWRDSLLNRHLIRAVMKIVIFQIFVIKLAVRLSRAGMFYAKYRKNEQRFDMLDGARYGFTLSALEDQTWSEDRREQLAKLPTAFTSQQIPRHLKDVWVRETWVWQVLPGLASRGPDLAVSVGPKWVCPQSAGFSGFCRDFLAPGLGSQNWSIFRVFSTFWEVWKIGDFLAIFSCFFRKIG